MKKQIILIITVIIALIGLFIYLVFNNKNYFGLQKIITKEDLENNTNNVVMSGEMACLPKIGQAIQIMECIMGFKNIDGKYYGLKNLFEVDPEYKLSVGGLKVEVSGILITEDINGPDDNKYDVVGTVDVDMIKEIGIKDIDDNDDIMAKKRKVIEIEYPEFISFEDQNNFAGQSVKTETKEQDHYFVYIVHGSGLPIVKATCFMVDRIFRVFKVGEFPDPLDSYVGYRDINIQDCRGIR